LAVGSSRALDRFDEHRDRRLSNVARAQVDRGERELAGEGHCTGLDV
jgi:hypothetical protein